MTRKIIAADPTKAPAAVGPYSQGVVGTPTLFMAGQIPLDPATMKLVAGGVTEQTEQVFSNIAGVLEAAGKSLDDVIKVTVFLTTMDDFAAMNAVYATKFSEPFPARSTVAVHQLPVGASVEIELIVG
jgi:2-iminobutanoate/2-iminopropanoate deaminase